MLFVKHFSNNFLCNITRKIILHPIRQLAPDCPRHVPPQKKKQYRITCSIPNPHKPTKKKKQEPPPPKKKKKVVSSYLHTITFFGLPWSPSHTSSTTGSGSTGSTSISTASRVPLNAVSANCAAKPQGLEA